MTLTRIVKRINRRVEGRRWFQLLAMFVAAWPGSLEAQAVHPPSPPTVRGAASALAAGDLKGAETELHEILKASPLDVHAMNLLGIVYAQQKREPEAEALFKQAIALHPEFAGAEASLGLLYIQMAKYDLAVPPLEEALRLDPGREDARSALLSARRGQAHGASDLGDLEKALALLIEARRLNPDDAGVEYDLGMISLRMSLFPDAVTAFDHVLKVRPDDPQALYGLGRSKMALAKFDEAEQAFEKYVHLRPDDASGFYALGFTLEALEHTAEAREEYEKSIVLEPQQTESYFHLGLISLEAGDLNRAQEKFERVLKRAPQHAGALTGMGRIRFQQKQYPAAADFLKKAVDAQPKLREPHYYLGMVYARLGSKDNSEKELETASQIEHEEVEHHQNVLTVLDPDQVHVPETQPTSKAAIRQDTTNH